MKTNHLKILFLAVCALLTVSGEAQTVRWVVQPEFTAIAPYGKKLFKVNTGKNQAIIDGRGRTLFTADSINSHADGMDRPYQPDYNPDITVYEENGMKGYKVNGRILLPAQLEEVGLFADGLAIGKQGGKYGILQYLNGTVDCRVNERAGRLDVTAIIPPAWDDKEARFVRISNSGRRLSLAMAGMRSMRNLSADVPTESGRHQYELIVGGLIIWKGSSSADAKTVGGEKKEAKGDKQTGKKTEKKDEKKGEKKSTFVL